MYNVIDGLPFCFKVCTFQHNTTVIPPNMVILTMYSAVREYTTPVKISCENNRSRGIRKGYRVIDPLHTKNVANSIALEICADSRLDTRVWNHTIWCCSNARRYVGVSNYQLTGYGPTPSGDCTLTSDPILSDDPTNIPLQLNPSYSVLEMCHQQLMSSRLENESKYVNL